MAQLSHLVSAVTWDREVSNPRCTYIPTQGVLAAEEKRKDRNESFTSAGYVRNCCHGGHSAFRGADALALLATKRRI